jgi:DNA topoisomerase-1
VGSGDYECPSCGRPMILRYSRRVPFLGCTGYPGCKTVMVFNADGEPVAAPKPTGLPTDLKCDICGKPMGLRKGPRGSYLVCTGYPKCKTTKSVGGD